jgi:hypothetical protein
MRTANEGRSTSLNISLFVILLPLLLLPGEWLAHSPGYLKSDIKGRTK